MRNNMKLRCFLTGISCFFSLSLLAKGPEICWLETLHDFGAFDEALGLVTTTFKAVNTGDEPLIILSARANCGCTTPRYTLESILPGDTAKLSVSYDAKGRPGRFDKKVYVTSNAEKNSVLTITGTVIGASNSLKGRYPVDAGKMRLSSTVLPFGEVKKGHAASTMLRAYNASDDTIRPVVTKNPAYIKFRISPESVPPGEQFAISGTISTSEYPIWGLVTDSVTIQCDANDPTKASADISTVAIINEDFSKLSEEELNKAPVASVESDLFDMDHIGWNDGKAIINSKIFNKGKNPLLIHRLYSTDPAITVKTGRDTVKGGKSIELTIIVDSSKIPAGEPLNARITMITNDPSSPTRILRVVGEPNKK